MTPITYQGWCLVDDQGRPVHMGTVRTSFRGLSAVITGGLPPHKDSSTGFVYTASGAEHYTTVYDLKWVRGEPEPPAGYTAAELERDNPYNQWMYEQPTEDNT